MSVLHLKLVALLLSKSLNADLNVSLCTDTSMSPKAYCHIHTLIWQQVLYVKLSLHLLLGYLLSPICLHLSIQYIFITACLYTHILSVWVSVLSKLSFIREHVSCRLILLVSRLFFGNYFRYLSLFLLYILALILVFNSMFDKSPIIIIIIIIGIKIDKKIKMQSYSLSSENLCVHQLFIFWITEWFVI